MRAQASPAHGASDMAAAYEQPSPRVIPDSPDAVQDPVELLGYPPLDDQLVDKPTPLGMGTKPGWLAQGTPVPRTDRRYTMVTEARGRVRVEDGPKRVRTYLGGELIADTVRPKLVWEVPYYPTYYIPEQDVRMEPLTPTDPR